MPYDVYDHCEYKGLLDRDNPIWRRFKVYKIKTKDFYKNTKNYRIEVWGSSKSVHQFFLHIQKHMINNIEYTDQDEWYTDKINFPEKYQKSIKIAMNTDAGKFVQFTHRWPAEWCPFQKHFR